MTCDTATHRIVEYRATQHSRVLYLPERKFGWLDADNQPCGGDQPIPQHCNGMAWYDTFEAALDVVAEDVAHLDGIRRYNAEVRQRAERLAAEWALAIVTGEET